MKQGRAKESVECLERALRVDYQDQFQHSVSQEAIMCWLAQAYEAAGQPEKAEKLYQVILQLPVEDEDAKTFSRNRIIAIRVASGVVFSEGIGEVAKASSEESQPAGNKPEAG